MLPTVVSMVTGLAIWIPTQAMQPRYNFGPPRDRTSEQVYVVLMVLAPIVLAVLFSTRWETIAVGLVFPQLVLAPWTTPRGDGDGLWALIFPMLVVGGLLVYVVVYATAAFVRARSQ